MASEKHLKRLFFAFEIFAPWPQELPSGRLLKESERHATVAFLGQTDFANLSQHLHSFPILSFKIGPVGVFNRSLFLPPRHPNVVAWEMEWWDKEHEVKQYQKEVVKWLKDHGFVLDEREWLPHVTLCRQPFNRREWENAFYSMPYIVRNLHLYESLGQLHYQPCWSAPLKEAIEEIEHTADIAFRIRGETIQQILIHAFCALAFKSPSLLTYSIDQDVQNLDDVIIYLNEIVSRADEQMGCSFKAISFHGELKEEEPNVLTWDMIIDV